MERKLHDKGLKGKEKRKRLGDGLVQGEDFMLLLPVITTGVHSPRPRHHTHLTWMLPTAHVAGETGLSK